MTRPKSHESSWAWLLAFVVAVALAVLAWWLNRPAEPASPPQPTPVVAAPSQPVEAASALAATAPVTEPSAPPADPAPLPEGDEAVAAALVERFGRAAVLTLLQTDGLATRIAATVDNLPRRFVAPRLWPVNPAPGRFTVDADGRISAGNARRYDALVGLLDLMPPADAAAFYRRLHPQLQAAYDALGYPGRSFHRRLLVVVDHLLETPVPAAEPRVALVEIKGDVPSVRPWVRYEYADPVLESRSAGQRILLRLGPAHQDKVMTWLRGLRAALRS